MTHPSWWMMGQRLSPSFLGSGRDGTVPDQRGIGFVHLLMPDGHTQDKWAY